MNEHLVVAALVVLVLSGGVLVEIWYQRARRRAAASWRAAQRAVQSSPLPDRRPQDDLEGWR